MWLLIAILILIIFNLAFKNNSKNTRSQTIKDEQIMRHTITVNLNILEGEIVELTALIAVGANKEPLTTEQKQAIVLLENAQATAHHARLYVSSSGYDELLDMLGQVYSAMNFTTSARRLLNACRPL